MATISKNIPKLEEKVSEAKVPSNVLSVVKTKIDGHANALKKDLSNLANNLNTLASLNKKLAKNGGLAGNLSGKPLKSQVQNIAKKLDKRATWCKNRSKILTEAINASADDMQRSLVKSCSGWEEFQKKFNDYGL